MPVSFCIRENLPYKVGDQKFSTHAQDDEHLGLPCLTFSISGGSWTLEKKPLSRGRPLQSF